MSSSGYTTQNVQEFAAKFANTMLTQLNALATQTAGVEILYFRSTPVKAETDFLFHDYTLYNVEDCPLTMKAIYTNASYNESSYIFSQLGMDYQTPLELEIDITTWINAVSNDGTIPQAGDIIFIPQGEKIWEVSAMDPQKKAGQVVSYKLNCKKYQPSKHRYTGPNLTQTMDESTVNTEKQYGEQIKGSIQDLVDDPQTSVFVSTHKDPYKELPKTLNDGAIVKKRVNCIENLEKDLIIDGHTIARSCYNMSVIDGTIIDYKISDSIVDDEVRSLSIWFNIKSESEESKVKILDVQKGKMNTVVSLRTEKTFKNNTYVYLERGIIKLYGLYNDGKITVPNVILKKFPENWYTFTGFKIRDYEPVNLLSADADYPISVDVQAGRFLSLKVGDYINIINLKYELKPEKWYALIVNLRNKCSVSLFDPDSGLHKINDYEVVLDWPNNTIFNYSIKSSNSYLTNIRLYKVENTELATQLQDLVSYNIKNNSLAVINDSADIFMNLSYHQEES